MGTKSNRKQRAYKQEHATMPYKSRTIPVGYDFTLPKKEKHNGNTQPHTV